MSPVLRLLGIVAVFLLALVSWLSLGGVTLMRTTDLDTSLRSEVADLFGAPQTQSAPTFTQEWSVYQEKVEKFTDASGRESSKVTPEWVPQALPVEPSQSRVTVGLTLDERRKGLLWFPLYDVEVDGTWLYVHDAADARDVRIAFEFPDSQGQYDEFRFVVDGVDVSRQLASAGGTASYVLRAQPGQKVTLAVHYRSRGMSSWRYVPTRGVGQIEDFRLDMHTDFAAIDFPSETLSPTARVEDGDGWSLSWVFTRMVTGKGIGMTMPVPLQPGELASALSFSAPIPLALFFLWIYVLGLLRGSEIHPLNYLFLAAAFVSFNLLFAYTADRLPVEWAFGLSSLVSVFLVVSYLRLVVGPRFAFLEAGLAQLLYQVGFGLAHFFEGFTGLTVTVLGVVTLFALMQLTARVKWGEVLAGRRVQA